MRLCTTSRKNLIELYKDVLVNKYSVRLVSHSDGAIGLETYRTSWKFTMRKNGYTIGPYGVNQWRLGRTSSMGPR